MHTTHTRARAHTHARTHTRTHARTHARKCTHARTDAHTHTHTHTRTHTRRAQAHGVVYQGNGAEERVPKKTEEKKKRKKGFQGRFKRNDRGRMTDINRELVADNWSLARERSLTTGLCSEGWYSEHSGVCRRAELPGGSVKVKK